MTPSARRGRRILLAAILVAALAAAVGVFLLMRGSEVGDSGARITVTAPGGFELRAPETAFPDGDVPSLDVGEREDAFLDAFAADDEPRVLSIDSEQQPAEAVEVVLPYQPDSLPAGTTPAIFYFDEYSSLWLPIDTQADPDGGLLIGTTEHFTDFFSGVLEAIEDGVDAVATGVDWLAYQVAGVTGARVTKPDCDDDDLPDWVGGVQTTHQEGFPLSAGLFACAEAVPGRPDAVALRVAVNRAYGFRLAMDPVATSMSLEPSADLPAVLGSAFTRQFPDQDGTILAPGGSTVLIEFDRPEDSPAITVRGSMTAETALIDALMFTFDVGKSFASADKIKSSVEAFECAVDDLQAAGDINSGEVFVGTWTSMLKDCLEPILGPLASAEGKKALSRVGAGITVGLSLGQLAQSFLDRERDLLDGVAVTVAVRPAGVGTVFAGRWTGPVDQPGSRPYSTVVDIADDGGPLSGVVAYPELGCSGTWTQVSREGGTATMLEQITDDPQSSCVREVDIHLTLLADGRLRVGYWDSFEAVLTRTGDAAPTAPSGTLEPSAFVADWSGPIDQPGAIAYSLQLQLGQDQSGRLVGGAHYPELGCSGLWDETSRDAGSVTVVERIDSDPQSRCVPEGTITLSLDSAGHLLVEGRNPTFTGVLTRQPD